jgi:hypothetical protein
MCGVGANIEHGNIKSNKTSIIAMLAVGVILHRTSLHMKMDINSRFTFL